MQLQRFRSDPQKRTITTAGVNYSLAAVDAGNPKHAVGDNLRREELANHILNVPASVPWSRKTALYQEDDRAEVGEVDIGARHRAIDQNLVTQPQLRLVLVVAVAGTHATGI